ANYSQTFVIFTNFYGKEYHLQKISYTTQQILHKKMAFFSGHGGLKGTKAAWSVIEMSFWRLQKDKRTPDSDRNVLLKASKGQKRPGWCSKCPFGASKGQKRLG
ncbi:hypothetical protein ABC651_17055, partial [Heyndrickxia faecalis]